MGAGGLPEGKRTIKPNAKNPVLQALLGKFHVRLATHPATGGAKMLVKPRSGRKITRSGPLWLWARTQIPVHILALHSRLIRRDEFRARPAAEKDAAALAETV